MVLKRSSSNCLEPQPTHAIDERQPIAWATTGELYCRNVLNARVNKEPKPDSKHDVNLRREEKQTVFANSTQGFIRFLTQGNTADDVKHTAKKHIDQILKVKHQLAELRESRIASLESLKHEFKLRVSRLLSGERSRLNAKNANGERIKQGLDRYLIEASEVFVSTLESERETHRVRREQELLLAAIADAQTKRCFNLTLFALHLYDETQGEIRLTKLQTNHPQFMRCRKAAVENVKPGFFAMGSNPQKRQYRGIKVLDIFKIENSPMLDMFQQRTSSFEGAKVKGLFCKLDPEAVHRTAAFGFLSDEQIDSLQRRESRVAFQRSWYSFSQEKHGFAEKRVRQGKCAKFPRTFSRYSTQEADRESVNRGPTKGNQDDHENVQYLCLCRVLIGSHFVTSKGSPHFPDVSSVLETGAVVPYDSMYNPETEEYLMLNTEYVLPEFFIQYRWDDALPAKLDLSGDANDTSALLLRDTAEAPLLPFNPRSLRQTWLTTDSIKNTKAPVAVDTDEWENVQERARVIRDQCFRYITRALRMCVEVEGTATENSSAGSSESSTSKIRPNSSHETRVQPISTNLRLRDSSNEEANVAGCAVLEKRVEEFVVELKLQRSKTERLLLESKEK